MSYSPILQLFPTESTDATRVVNVACVPQRSLFRYPGGKTWLVPQIRKWLSSLPHRPRELIEPFAGGGIVSLTAAFENLVGKVTLVELDEDVAAVWITVLDDSAEWLADRVVNFDLTPESVAETLAETPQSTPERAFQTLLRNRVLHGGILAPGSGLIKHGENGKGLRSRWYPSTLRKRILNIARIRERISFVHGDGMQTIRENAHRADAAFFIDPPYTAAGKRAGRRLYRHNELDHQELFRSTAALASDFLMTYDYADGVLELARQYGLDTEAVAMSNTHHAIMRELLIGRDLHWARG